MLWTHLQEIFDNGVNIVVNPKNDVDTVQLIKDDFLDLCEKAIWKCKKCRYKGWEKCDRYKLFIKLNVPVFDEETEDCPYRM